AATTSDRWSDQSSKPCHSLQKLGQALSPSPIGSLTCEFYSMSTIRSGGGAQAARLTGHALASLRRNWTSSWRVGWHPGTGGGEAIARVRPYGIDVSSGVESAPGIKDHGRLKALFEAVHGSHHATRS